MKRFYTLFTFFCILMGCKGANNFQSVDVETFAQLLQDSSVIILDVRTESEYKQGHIKGAILMDVTLPHFKDSALKELPKEQTIAIYCRSGRRSKTAAQLLAAEGYKVVELNTGINTWKGEVKSGLRP